jgi:hypothetical protein
MSTAKWATPGTEVSIAGTALDSLANGSTSARMAHDNSTNLDLYARVTVELGSITPATGGSITLRYLGRRSTNDENIVTSLESYQALLSSGASAKRAIFEMVRLYPFAAGFVLTNNSGVALAASSNAINVQPYNESIV